MSKELLISIILGCVLVISVVSGLINSSLLSNPLFLMFGMAIILGQIVMAHLAFNQYKNISTETTKESTENEEGKDRRGEEDRSDGFDD